MYNNHDDKIKAKEEFKFRNFIAIRSISELTNFGEYAHSEIRFLFIK